MQTSSSFSLPNGFRTAGIACGIKSDATTADLALFISDRQATAAGVFTTNRVCGAPVQVSRERLPTALARGVIINSGNSNACTGERGIADAKTMTKTVADLLNCAEESVLVCSTGVIGHPLPLPKLVAGIPQCHAALADDAAAFEAAARAMMTTDTVPKQAVRRVNVGGQAVLVSGVAKGAAMIAPNMATMLAVVMTDAAFTPEQAHAVLRSSVETSFNRISVDGHTSTSDSVILLANGASAADGNCDVVRTAIAEVCAELAEKIIRDAEGATHFVRVEVTGADSEADAVVIARAIADSPLVKTAVAGADPNWGRIVSAAGYSGVPFEETAVSLRINGTLVYNAGLPQEFDDAKLSREIRDNYDVKLELNLGQGSGSALFLTCDLTAEYVRLNADYTT